MATPQVSSPPSLLHHFPHFRAAVATAALLVIIGMGFLVHEGLAFVPPSPITCLCLLH